MEIWHTHGAADTHARGAALAALLRPGTLVALSGDLGTGKTTLVRGICDALGCADQVTSPTFTIVNEYEGAVHVRHCDLYRLGSVHEMLEIGLDDVFTSDAVILVEWAERALALLPVPRIEIVCAHEGDEEARMYRVHMCTDASDSILPADEALA